MDVDEYSTRIIALEILFYNKCIVAAVNWVYKNDAKVVCKIFSQNENPMDW